MPNHTRFIVREMLGTETALLYGSHFVIWDVFVQQVVKGFACNQPAQVFADRLNEDCEYRGVG